MAFEDCPCSGKTLAKLLQPAVMSVLAEEPLHGYLIAQRLRSLALFRDSPPDYAGIYRLLSGMEERRLVRAERCTPQAGPAARRYDLTRRGRCCLGKWLLTLKKYRRAVDELTSVLESCTSRTRMSR